MNRIQPKIFNGGWQLVMSETICCNPSRGLEVHIPVTPEIWSYFQFIFITDAESSNSKLHISTKENDVIFTLTNFLMDLGASLLNPFEFKIGSDKYFLQMHGISKNSELLNLTISIFKDNE